MQEETFKIAVVARMKHGVLYEAIKKRGLMELTGMTVEDLFLEAVRSDEFLDKPKVFERSAEVPLDKFIGYRETLALPPTPDKELIEKEEEEEISEIVSKLPFVQKHAFERLVLEGKTQKEAECERGLGRGAVAENLRTAARSIAKEIKLRRQREKIDYEIKAKGWIV
jgi:DNA-directed RNA polymerase specialized sigma24 family protein